MTLTSRLNGAEGRKLLRSKERQISIRPGERVGVSLALVAIVAFYAWSAHFWVDLVDEGYFLDLGQRVLDGALPYSDFTTYYTPGTFYLIALVFKLFGTNLLVVRYLMAGLRALCALLLYGLTRRVAPWPIAWLPFLLLAAFDHWPIEPEPHPSWPSVVACLVTIECLVRHLDSGRIRWLTLAGATAGLSYLFKQNVGVFAALGVGGYVLLRPRARAGATLRAAQVLFAIATAIVVTLLMWSNLDVLSAGALWLPLVATLGLLLFRAIHGSPAGRGSVILDTLAPSSAFVLVTMIWLVPLLIAIGPGETPLGLFVGEVNQAPIATPYSAFTSGVPALLLIVIWLPTLLVTRHRGMLFAAVGLSVLALALPIWQGPRDPLTRDPRLLPLLTWADVNFGTLHLYLPSLAAWAGVAALLVCRDMAGPFPWYLLFGTLTTLIMYPRADALHSIVSSPVVLIAGAGALALVVRGLHPLAMWRKAAIMTALLAVPVAALGPQLLWRAATVISPEEDGQWLDYESLNLQSAPVLVPRHMAEDMRNVVAYIQAGTPPGSPFLAYPVEPVFNFLADRHNPTRFDHFLPGTLTDEDFAEVISEMQAARPRYVLWDHLGVLRWYADPANRPLSDYIWRCYNEVAAFHLYLVMERNDSC